MTEEAMVPAEEPGYADAMAELGEILAELEGDRLDVDVLAERVRRASELIRACRGRIARARTDVDRIVAELEELEPVERLDEDEDEDQDEDQDEGEDEDQDEDEGEDEGEDG